MCISNDQIDQQTKYAAHLAAYLLNALPWVPELWLVLPGKGLYKL